MGGTCGKVTAEDKAAADKSRAIDKELLQAKKKATKEVKLLLLGAGASGKSTVAKQMHILYLNGFGENELAEYKAQIATNMVNNMRNLLLGAQKLGISPPPPSPSPFLLI
jgi:guanine nucleotide-binding protein subunit alpha